MSENTTNLSQDLHLKLIELNVFSAYDLNYFRELIEAAIAFYKGMPSTGLTDKEYDERRVNLISRTGKDVFHFIELVDGLEIGDEIPSRPFEAKEQVDGSLKERIKEYVSELGEDYLISPKYDGSGIKAIYRNGRLMRIISGDLGIDRTAKLKSFFPENIDPSITQLHAEALVSLSHGLGGLTRNKANGLINSKYLQDEVDEMIEIRIFNIDFEDGVYDFKRLATYLVNFNFNLPNKTETATILSLDQVPESDRLETKYDNFLVDGVVVYHEKGIRCFKFYYTETKEVIIKNISWGESDYEAYSPVAEFDTVTLQDTNVSRASYNGCNFLFDNKCGIGSKVLVARVNSTIPKIVKILETSENYGFPTCTCGKVINTQYGNSIKCSDPECTNKYEVRVNWIERNINKRNATLVTKKDFIDLISIDTHVWIGELLNIERWNAKSKFIFNSFILDSLENSFKDNNSDLFKKILESCFNYSDNAYRIMELNYLSLFKALSNKYNSLTDENA